MLGGLSVVPLTTYPGQLGYSGASSMDAKIKLGTLVASSGRRTQSEGETIELLLTSNFPI
jgi:hypothetical protein